MPHFSKRMIPWGLALLTLTWTLAGCRGTADPAPACHAGAYELDSGQHLAITPSDDDTLRYRMFEGPSGRLYPDGGARYVSGDGWSVQEPVTTIVTFDDCETGGLQFQSGDGAAVAGHRLALQERRHRFRGRDVELAGKLVLPPGAVRAVVVLAHGSEKLAATEFYAWQYLLPPQGIGVFVFDKRGTGSSGGEYTQDFDVLADDIAAAVREVRQLLAPEHPPLGLLSGSQGGWVAPLAATRAKVDFVIAAYGMAESPLAEDREEVLASLVRAGYGDEVLAKARELTAATGAVMVARFDGGFEELDRVKRMYGDEPWIKDIEGEFTHDLLKYPSWLLRIVGPWFDVGTPWSYDPLPVLEAVEVPMLWIIGGKDTEAPPGRTLAILEAMQPRPGQLDIAIFPDAEHGIITVTGEGDDRRLLGHADGYWALQAHWILERDLNGAFGRAVLLPDREAMQMDAVVD